MKPQVIIRATTSWLNPVVLIFFLIMFGLCMIARANPDPSALITTWKTDNPGTSANNQITIPTLGGGGSYDYTIDWGDNTSDDITTDAAPTHTYASPGTYTVTITGTFPRLAFPPTAESDNQKLLTVEQWGDIVWNVFSFQGCTNLVVNATDAPDLSSADLLNTFEGCTSFNSDINHWNTSAVEYMQDVFKGATSFNQPLDNWDVSNVIDMSGMFFNARSFNQDLSIWNVSRVENMNSMFFDALEFNQPIGTWKVSAV
ncbi:MAG: BspA family leucine-rich repeat surface protein, partial [Bacteroidota bacterium]